MKRIVRTVSRRSFLWTAATVSAFATRLRAEAAPKPPNILFVFSDDHSLRTIGAYGSGFHATPNIDRIAAEGAVFEQSFCCNSICQPSRAAILTGKHSHMNGVTNNGSHWDGDQTIFPRLLQQADYQTALRGKWHMHPNPSTEFDSWEVLSGAGGQGHYYNPEFVNAAGTVVRQGYATDVITDQAIQWLEKERDPAKPFMLMCQFKAPHVPRMPALRYIPRYKDQKIKEPETLFDDYQTRHHAADAWMRVDKMADWILNIFPPDDPMSGIDKHGWQYFERMSPETRQAYFDAYEDENRTYFKMLADGTLKGAALKRYRYQRFIKDYLRIVDGIDDNVGRLLAWLEQNGLAENTVVIYSSDQGYYVGEHGWAEKRWMYEESVKMPFVIRWPGVIKPGSRPDAMIQNIDYAPTFLEMAGLPVPGEMQGRSIVPVLCSGKRPDNWRRIIYYHYYAHGQHNVPRHEGVRSDRYKLIHFYTDNTWEMYDLKSDPNELKNLADQPEHAQKQQHLEKELTRLRSMYRVPENRF